MTTRDDIGLARRVRSRRLDPAVKAAHKQHREYLHLFTCPGTRLSPEDRAKFTRQFIQMVVTDITQNFPEQLIAFDGIDPAVAAQSGEGLEALALKIAELKIRLHATPGGVRGAVIH